MLERTTWKGTSLESVRDFTTRARQQTGYQCIGFRVDLSLLIGNRCPRSGLACERFACMRKASSARTETRKMTTRNSKNVFRDLGFGPAEAESLRIRSALMIELTKHIQRAGLTQKEAAEQLGVSQPRISDLTRGKIDVFSIDMLISMLSRIGIKTSIRVGRKRVA